MKRRALSGLFFCLGNRKQRENKSPDRKDMSRQEGHEGIRKRLGEKRAWSTWGRESGIGLPGRLSRGEGRAVRRVKKFPEILDKAGFDLYNCNRSAAH